MELIKLKPIIDIVVRTNAGAVIGCSLGKGTYYIDSGSPEVELDLDIRQLMQLKGLGWTVHTDMHGSYLAPK